MVSTGSTRRLSDHLGSTSITTDADGNKISEMRYKPWGEVRYAWTATQTTTPAYELAQYTFTGQYSYMDDITTQNLTEGFGLMFYNARWYDPALGRFAQADTIIPSGVQGLDRYAAMNNNPLKYIDPDGHCAVKPGFKCAANPKITTDSVLERLIRREIDRRFDPYRGWLPSHEEYGTSKFPTLDYEAEEVYVEYGYDIVEIASNNHDNPMTEEDWKYSGFDLEYIYLKGV